MVPSRIVNHWATTGTPAFRVLGGISNLEINSSIREDYGDYLQIWHLGCSIWDQGFEYPRILYPGTNPMQIWRQQYRRTFFFWVFLDPQHMEVPKPGVKSELQLLAYTTATAIWDLSHICKLHHSSWQCWILNPLTEAGDRTCIFMDTTWFHFRWAMRETPPITIKFFSSNSRKWFVCLYIPSMFTSLQ